MPLLNSRDLMWKCHQSQARPQRAMSCNASSTRHPMTMHHGEERPQKQPRLVTNDSKSTFRQDKTPLVSPLVAFLDQSNKCASPHLSDNMTSPRSVWEERPMNERLDPTASPRQTVTSTNRLVQTPPNTSSWRIQNLLSPDPSVNVQPRSSHKRRSPSSKETDVIVSSSKRPRRVSSQWRHELSTRDRAQTRERIMRSLHSHCQGDYKKLLLLLSSMEEELLHIKTTSSEFYAQQACKLSDLIEHATLER